MTKQKKQSRLDHLGESLSELHGEFEMHKHEFSMGIMILITSLPVGKQQAKEEKKKKKCQAEPTNQSLGCICKPKGQAGHAGGYKLIDALGLSEKKYKYNVLLDLMHKLTYQYLDTSHLLAHQTDKLLVKKVIRKAQSELDILMHCEGGWGAHDLIPQRMRVKSDDEDGNNDNDDMNRPIKGSKVHRHPQKKRKRVELDDEDGNDNDDMNRPIKGSKVHRHPQKKRKRVELDDEDSNDNDDNVNRPIKSSKVHKHPQKKRKRVKLDNEDDNDNNDDNVNRPIKDSKVHKCPQKKQVKLDDDDDDDDDDNDNDDNQGDIDYNDTKDEDNLEEEDDHRNKKAHQQIKGSQKKRNAELDSKDICPKVHSKGDKTCQHMEGNQKKRKRNRHADESDVDDGSQMQRPANEAWTAETQELVGNGSHTERLANKAWTAKTQESVGDGSHMHRLANEAQTAEKWVRFAQKPVDSFIFFSVLSALTFTQHGSCKKRRDDASLGPQDLTEDNEDNEAVQSSLVSVVTQEDFPTQCPGIYCKDKIPSELSKDLHAVLQKYVTITRKQGEHNFKIVQLRIQICIMVRKEYQRVEQLKIAAKKGWPISTIDFKKIPGHIVKLQDQLHLIVYNKSFHEQQDAWKSFEADLGADGWTLVMFAQMQNSVLTSRSATLDHAHGGYYGMKGSAIIQHTLIGLFPVSSELAAALQPLSHTQFMTYFLVPHIAALLIAEDYGYMMVTRGCKIMVNSSDAGALMHPEDDHDAKLEEIFQRNIITFQLKQLEILTCEVDSTQDAAQALLELQGQPQPHPRVQLVMLGDGSNETTDKS
ncbi:hypothetical protein V8B97DRAFT_1917195 [Scleroderma yunnanense]